MLLISDAVEVIQTATLCNCSSMKIIIATILTDNTVG
jgi:hypothetical protein